MSDLINGLMELAGSLLLLRNCQLLLLHKRVQGVSVLPTAFFILWGLWNLYFYPANGLWISFFGGICLATVNLIWVVLAAYYCRRSAPKTPAIEVELAYFRVPRPASSRTDFTNGSSAAH